MKKEAKSLAHHRPRTSSAMELVIDIGNTRTKLCLFRGTRMTNRFAYEQLSLPKIKTLFSRYPIRATILSSVVASNRGLVSLLRSHSDLLELNRKTPLPFYNKYGSKQTLGNDRIANAAGAVALFPNQNCLVIDAGTCVKYDFVNSKNEYLGGAISPGLRMRYQSLHRFTSKLPLVKPSLHVKSLGTSTRESITSGVQQGMLNEMNGFIEWYSNRYKNLKVILTGGDADCFARPVNFRIFAAPELTAIGLHGILQYNR